LLNESTPAQADPHGEFYCFERGAKKTGGGDGWADVWKKGFFAWEYKGKHKDLDLAFAQLQRYAIALENPPLLVVSDISRIEIHTNFTNTVHAKHVIPVGEIGTQHNLHLLKCLFSDPERLKPGKTKAAMTEEAAERFALIAQTLGDRGAEPQRVAHFLNRILFCLFAQDAKLLPENLVIQLLETGLNRPEHANQMLISLFCAMKKGGFFGAHVIDWFNGGLFDSSDAIPLQVQDIKEVLLAASLDWSDIEPSIFGTLFERGLDPAKRAQIGAHYTDAQSIMRIVQPAVVDPLVAQWEAARIEIRSLLGVADKGGDRSVITKGRKQARQIFDAFLRKLSEFRVLDPACGSGNFLYVALQALKDLEHRATLEAEQLGVEMPSRGVRVGVECVHGIESNTYAAELARVTVWIGEIQWMLRHGVQPSKNPILKPLETIECRDAVLNVDGKDSEWPAADVIIGNPPFLGNKRMLSELGETYTEGLRRLFKGRLPGGVDLVTYWFERARGQVEAGKAQRVGLVATQAIRKGVNRTVLDRIVNTAPIFEAWRDEPWVNNGAAVRVSIVVFGRTDQRRCLDGQQVAMIHPDLTSSKDPNANLAQARSLPENGGICFMGTSKVGPFDISGDTARAWLDLPNPKGLPNSDVLRPWANGQDLTGRPSDKWIIDFGTGMPAARAALYEVPFAHVERHVKPGRVNQRRDAYRDRWWIHAEARPGLRTHLSHLSRFIATPRLAKHRLFVWLPVSVLPDCQLFAICRDDDFTFGILSSRVHTVWGLANSSRHGDGDEGGRPRYSAANCFETFPFPKPNENAREVVASLARHLDMLRQSWLNPSPWVDQVPESDPRYSFRLIPKPGHEADLKARTLTNLYNERPAWLENAHIELDKAVAAAYGWANYTARMPDDEIIARLLELNQERAADLFSRSKDERAASNRPTTQSKSAGPVRNERPASETLERRLAVVCTLVNRLADEPHFGRTKMAKLFYLADISQDLDLDTNYFRQAAGPLDAVALYDAETGLEALAIKNRYLSVEKNLRKITYRRGPDLEKALENARTVLGKSRSAINKLIDLFRRLDTDQCEIVATLYACWNDRIIDQKDVSDKSIVEEFLSAWHDRKRRFPPARLLKALAWMRKNRLVPTGRGGHTKTTQKARSYQ
jgi:type II restriction/modification system DNA methylase subunit YeeA